MRTKSLSERDLKPHGMRQRDHTECAAQLELFEVSRQRITLADEGEGLLSPAFAEERALMRSIDTENKSHLSALNMPGKTFNGRPAMGSGIGNALGAETQDLPCDIVLRDPAGYTTVQKNGLVEWLVAGRRSGNGVQFVRFSSAPFESSSASVFLDAAALGASCRNSMPFIRNSTLANPNSKLAFRISNWLLACN